jgi:hypothetical protein
MNKIELSDAVVMMMYKSIAIAVAVAIAGIEKREYPDAILYRKSALRSVA